LSRWLAVAALLASGCFDFDSLGRLRDASSGGPTDALSDQASPDFAEADLSRALDGELPDLAQPDLAQPDLAVPDLSLPDLAQPDLATPDGASLPDLAVPDFAPPPDFSTADLATCAKTTAPAACGQASDLGTLMIGQSTSASSTLIPFGVSGWYKVTFASNTNSAYHPHVTLTANPGGTFRFDVFSDCANTAVKCGEGGLAIGVTEWEVFYDPNNTYNASSPSFMPVDAVGNAGSVWIRVYQNAGPPECGPFALSITNLCDANKLNGTDPANCGGCGNVCGALPNTAFAVCAKGQCTVGAPCLPGYQDCDNNKLNGCECHGVCGQNNACM
jgi:hypothetical protein